MSQQTWHIHRYALTKTMLGIRAILQNLEMTIFSQKSIILHLKDNLDIKNNLECMD